MNDLIIALFIYVLVPLAVFEVYLGLRADMDKAGIENPPHIQLLITLATYGGWLMMVLTWLLWRRSEMAVLDLFYLGLVAPVIMLMISMQLFSDRKTSSYHLGVFIASVGYFGLLGLLMVAFTILVVASLISGNA